MKKLFTFLIVALFSASMWGANAEYGNGKVIYLDISNASSTDGWKKDQATESFKIKMYYSDSDQASEIIDAYCCTRIGTSDVYYTTTDNSYVRYVQALRCASECGDQHNYSNRVSSASREDNNQNCIYIISDNASWWNTWVPAWKTYAPPMETVTLADNETEIISGTGTELDPYLVPAGTTIKVIASGTKAVADENATINYDFKEDATSKQDGTSATYSFVASETLNTIYTINLDGYTKVDATASTKLTATPLYYKTIDPAYVSLSATITDEAYINEAITVTATAHHAEATNYQFFEGEESKQNGASNIFAYTPTTKGEKTIKVIMTYAGGTKEATIDVSVDYEKWDIYVQNNCSWANMKLYLFDNGTNADWPGVACETYDGLAGSWYKVTLDDKYPKFIVNNGDKEQTLDNTLSKVNQPAGTTWQFVYSHEYSGTKYYFFKRSYVVTFGVGDVAGTEGTVTTSPSITSGDYVAQETSITFTRPAAKTGYKFKGWYANTTGTGDALGTDETYVVAIGAATTVYAVYEVDSSTALDNAAVEGQAIKTLENGMLIIEKNGVRYNVMGQATK